MRQFLIALCKILAVLGILVLLAAAVFSPRWAARPEDVKVPAPTPLPTAAPTPESTAAPTPAPTATPGPEATAEPTPEPTATPTPEPTPTVYTISVLGDCTLASYPEIRFWETSIENVVGENYDYPFSHTAELFDLDDLTIINLECSISDQQGWAASTFSFKAPAAYTEILTRGGVDFATTANNHALDFGQAILDDTVENLEKAGIVTCVEKQSILYTTDSGLMVGVYADYNGHLPSKDKVAEEVKKLKDAGAEAIVVCLHWGEEASYYQTGSQVEVAHAAIDAGATVVAGHGPHRLQPCEEYNGGVIFYSLANFIFGGNTQPQDMDTVVAQAMVTRELDGTVHYSGFRVYPASISSQSPLNDYCPTLFDEGTAEYARAMSKVDGSWTGANNTIDYSFMHQDEG